MRNRCPRIRCIYRARGRHPFFNRRLRRLKPGLNPSSFNENSISNRLKTRLLRPPWRTAIFRRCLPAVPKSAPADEGGPLAPTGRGSESRANKASRGVNHHRLSNRRASRLKSRLNPCPLNKNPNSNRLKTRLLSPPWRTPRLGAHYGGSPVLQHGGAGLKSSGKSRQPKHKSISCFFLLRSRSAEALLPPRRL